MTTNEELNDSLSTSILNGDGMGTPSQKKKMRRSWFETPPPTKLEIALEKKKRRSSGAARRKSDEEVETLILTHFTSAPRIGFGNIKVGKAKSRILIVRNPHEYEQEVIVERFPYKKNFSIDSTKFTVDPDDYKTLSITWAPDEASSCREMVLFKVDGVYRLQAYVFGNAEEIKQKKVTKRGKKGLLGIKVKKPFSIISTPGLACIRDNYSPLDAEKPRLSNVKQHPVVGEKYELLDKHSGENTPPPLESTAISVSSIGYTNNGDRVPELGCSPTFSPILKTSEVDGSCVVADSCYSDTQFSALRDVDDTSVISKRIAELEDKSSRLSDKDTLIDTPKNRKGQNSRNSSRNKSTENENKENSPLKCPKTKSAPEIIKSTEKKFLSPETFLNDSLNPDSVKVPIKQHPVFACIHENQTVSPNSFLEDMNNSHGDSSLKGEVPSPSKVLQDAIPHNLIVEQLKNVQTSLHEQSFDKLLSHTQKKCIQKISSSKAPVVNLSNPTVGKGAEDRRTTFLKQKQVKKTEKIVKKQVDYQSPRRTTFLVSLKKNRASVKKEELTKSCKKTESINKEDKPKRRKLLGSNKVGQTPVSKQGKSREEKEEVITFDSVAMTRTKEVVEEVTIQTETQQVYQIFTGTVTKDKPSPNLQDTKRTHGKRLFDSNSPKKDTSPLARTVTKDKPSQVHGKVIGKNLFEDRESTITPQRTSPFIDEFGSPSVLPSSPSEISTRRTTLTVTKQRPSDALLHATQRVLDNNVFECTPTGRESNGENNDTCMVIEMKKSPSLLKVEDPTKSLFTQAPVSPVLLGSPSKLPTSPNPDMSRRSTHLVASPKFVDLSSVSPKRLFPPLDDVLEPVSEEKEKPDSINEKIENQENIPPVVDQLSIPNESTMSLKSLEDLSKDISDISIESETSVRSLKSSERQKSSQKVVSPKKPSRSGSSRQSVRERKPSGSSSGGKKEFNINNSTGNRSITPDVFSVTLSPTSSKTKTKPPVPTSVKKTKPFNSGTVSKPPPSRRQSLAPSTSRERLDTVSKATTDRRRSVNPVVSKMSAEKKFEPVASLTRSTNNRNTPRENLKSSTNLDKSTTKQPKTSTAPVIKKSLSTSVPSSTKKPRGPVKGLSQTKLMLIKKPKTAVPKHPMPFAARNMYYDERWLEKQERGFSHWLNFILTPPEEYNNNVEKTKVDAGSIFVDGMKGSGNTRLAPTKEVLSIRAYTARRRMNRLRRASCQLYQSESVIHVIRKVEIEVESRRLAVRKDRMLHADLGIKQSILDMLLCYNPLWLRIGLETIFGEMILLQSNNDVIGLSRFILYRLLSNPDIAAEYAHASVPHLYRDGYAEASSSHTLKKFLLLVYFLDKAKQSRLIDHDPCLFCKNADIKASKNLLVQFSRDFLSGEGDITKHLGYLGYIVSHIQTPLDEFDYAVSALGVDLRDGLRLTRVMEYLTNNWTLMSSLRSPAISRLQKIHNVEVVFKVLAERGLDVSQLDMKLNARDIVDGHREKTLNLLWHIIFHFQVDVLIDIEQLKAEIVILEKTLRVKVSMQKLLKSSADNQARRDSGETDVLKNERLTLLLKWCRLVCLHYGIKVENFTVSFSDGRALCYLIHHYYPALLPANLINTQTTASYMEAMEKKEEEEFDEDASFDWSQTPQSDLENPEMFEQLLISERENFKLLYEKVSGLGGIPLMLKAADMSNTIPDEKIVMTYVSHLCGRLLDIRAESRAARVIQIAWRKYWLRHAVQHQQKLNNAARVIQIAYREYRNRRLEEIQTCTAIKLQALWRGYKARKRTAILRKLKLNYKMSKAAHTIQRALQSNVQRKRYLRMKTAAVKVQSLFRGYMVRKQIQRQQKAVKTIQSFYHGYKQTLEYRQRFLSIKSSCITIQRKIKCFLKEKEGVTVRSAVIIQKYVRGFLQRLVYHRQLQYIIKIQANYRRHRKQTKFLAMKYAAIFIQRYYRKYKYECLMKAEKQKEEEACILLQHWYSEQQKLTLQKQNDAATKIQAIVRGFLCRKHIHIQNQAAIKLQSLLKMKIASNKFLRQKAAAIVLSHHFRSYLQQKRTQEEVKIQRNAAVKIQSQWRFFSQQRNFNSMKCAVVKIQSLIRRHIAVNTFQTKRQAAVLIQRRYRAVKMSRVKEYETYNTAVISIQTAFKTYMAVKTFRKQKLSAVKIQSYVKMVRCRKDFVRMKKAIEVIQVRIRAFQLMKQVQSEFQLKKTSCVKLQSYYRGHITRKQLHKMNTSATKIQATYRTYIAKQRFQKICQATRTLQTCYRNSRITKQCQGHFQKQKSSAILIQKCFRLYMEKRSTHLRKSSATMIQSAFRGYMARKSFQKVHSTVIFLQRLYKSSQITKTTRNHYLHQKHCTLVIQTVFRGYVIRRSYLKQRKAAITIQTVFRRWTNQHEYQRLKSVVCQIQRIYRNNRIAKCQRLSFVCMKKAAIRLQSCYHGYQQRMIYQRTLITIIRIQTWWRCISSYRKYCHDKKAIVNLQRLIRRNIEMKQEMSNLACKKAAILKIQSVYRGYVARKSYSHKMNAAVKIQSAWRGYMAYQQFWRIKRSEFLQTRKAAVCLQSVYKAKIIRQCYVQQRSSAITIQSWWRTILAIQLFKTQRKAASTIQMYYRNYREKKLAVEIQSKKEKSASLIQQFWRQYHDNKMKKQNMAAVKIQASVRTYLLQKQYRKKQASAICIQSVYRAYKTRKLYQNIYYSVVIIQNRWRAALKAKKARKRYLMTYGAIITIQAMVRGFLTRKKIKDENLKCILIQSNVRGYLARLHFLKLKAAAIVLQNIYRSNRLTMQTRAEYLQKKLAVLQIQKWYRSCRLIQTIQQLSAAIKIQSWYRCVRQRQTYCENRRKIICVQSCVRRYLSQKHSHQILSAIVTIQRNVRTYLLVKRLRCAIQKRHKSALLIQNTFRKCVRLKTERKHEAAIKIQSVVRSYHQRKVYKETINCVTVIQARIRTYLIRKQYHNLLVQHRAACTIQSAYRNHIIHLKEKAEVEKRRDFVVKFSVNVKYHLSAIVIQRLYLKHIILKRAQQYLPSIIYIQRKFRARKERRQFLTLRSLVCNLQNNIRYWLHQRHNSAIVLQKAVKLWLVKHRLEKQHRLICKIQAVWKGYVLRKKTHTKKLAEIRRRINKANESACEENKLGNRTTSALDYLLRYKQMSYVLEAVMHLEVATRLSPRCCERMVEVNAISVIFTLMKSCNRSLPHMEVIKYSISILLNLAKYEKTIDYVYDVEDSISNLLELMTIFREKGNIFTKTATLIGILALDHHRKQGIVSNRNYTDKIKSMYALTARKHKLEEGRNLVKAKIAASRTFNSTLPLSTPAKKRRIRPDWILNRDSIHEIENPMRAIKFVMDNLGLAPK
ncbi:hypothetical protein LOTGIDRAFT_232956 [Lottia gigantea]|uniref:Calponin-homology (CH) domain-containing protein n=1 Tax=Lottia gigantea TaxID=225164 RepID=V4BV55_LOTGI|nr:hypothetical protein LOTGIDRAFT_232956 [Lottia gigantea]ESO92879.1 hypothetical protein LOTGIDRAFT_232956 [Lottia gigantea]